MHRQTRVAIYTRVSTSDQDCARQIADLQRVATQRGYQVVTVARDVRSGTKLEAALSAAKAASQSAAKAASPLALSAAKATSQSAAPRRKRAQRRIGANATVERDNVLALAQSGKVDAILVTELSRWSRSLPDLLATLQKLATWNVSLLCANGQEFDFQSATGRLLVSVMGAFAAFERDLIAERTVSGLHEARRRGVRLGRKPGYSPRASFTAQVCQLRSEGHSISAIATRTGLNRRTVAKLAKADA